MSISSVVSRNDYLGNDATKDYDFVFQILAASHLRVIVQLISTGAETVLVENTDYTIPTADVGAAAGGTITLVNAAQAWLTGGFLRSTYKITLRRVLPVLQPTDIRNQGDFFPEVHETAFDRGIMIALQQQDELDRSIKASETQDPGSFDATFPVVSAADADKSIVLNATGNGLALGPTSADIAGAGPAATTAVAAAAAAAASAAAAAASAASILYLWGGTVGGTPDAITLTPTPALTAYGSGNKLAFVATGTNTGAATVNVSGLGVKSIKSGDGDALVAGEILSGTLYYLTYDGTNFRLGDSIVTTTKGDIQGHGTTEPVRIPVGTNGQVLTADSVAAPGVSWQTPSTAGAPLHFRKGGRIKRASASTVTVAPVAVEIDGQVRRTTVATTLDMTTDFVNGSEAANQVVHVYAKANGTGLTMKLSDEAPDLADILDNTVGDLRYQKYTDYYRYLGCFFNGAGSDIMAGSEVSFDASPIAAGYLISTGSDQVVTTGWTPDVVVVHGPSADATPSDNEGIEANVVTKPFFDAYGFTVKNSGNTGQDFMDNGNDTAGNVKAITEQSALVPGSFTIKAMTANTISFWYAMASA